MEARMRVDECVVINEILPQPRFASAWGSIITGPAVKERLLHATLLGLQLRPQLPFEVTALHGLVLLYGPPGTGKTTLARGVAHELAGLVEGRKTRLVEINPHGLMSAEHGQSQQKVFELLCDHIPLLADDKFPTVVVLDEVESMTISRSAASLSANPADVHRATDAVLEALDRNAADHPHLVTVATSNFTEALDEAFISRADAAIEVPLPGPQAIAAILARTLGDFAVAYPVLGSLVGDPRLAEIATLLKGADGRRVRKLVTDAMTRRRETVLDPGSLTVSDLESAARAVAMEPVKEARHGAS
jgi:SpoVK/Ycf46/Vps4 family AAA+-type ATPase